MMRRTVGAPGAGLGILPTPVRGYLNTVCHSKLLMTILSSSVCLPCYCLLVDDLLILLIADTMVDPWQPDRHGLAYQCRRPSCCPGSGGGGCYLARNGSSPNCGDG